MRVVLRVYLWIHHSDNFFSSVTNHTVYMDLILQGKIYHNIHIIIYHPWYFGAVGLYLIYKSSLHNRKFQASLLLWLCSEFLFSAVSYSLFYTLFATSFISKSALILNYTVAIHRCLLFIYMLVSSSMT